MKNSFVCCVLIAQLLCLPSSVCPPTPLPWDIDDPADGSSPVYTGDISCSGEATTAANYIVKVMASNNDILQSKGSTSGTCSWATTVPEPQGGWPLFAPGSPRPAELQLFSGGVKKDSEAITLN